jgi:hypothetical protein
VEKLSSVELVYSALVTLTIRIDAVYFVEDEEKLHSTLLSTKTGRALTRRGSHLLM